MSPNAPVEPQPDFIPAPAMPGEPGAITVVDIDGTAVAIANIGGQMHAFEDECSHRSCPLSEGSLVESIVTCPCHKSRFDIRTGAVLNGPATLPIRVRKLVHDGEQWLVERS